MLGNHFKDYNYVCHNGFFIIEVNKEGFCQPCCPDWCNKYNFGNIFTDDIEDIINSEQAKKFRKSILDGTYQFCNKDSCLSHSINKYDVKSFCDSEGKITKFPEIVRFSYDRTCNLKCITCRNDYISDSDKFKKFDSLIDSSFLPLIRNTKIVHLNTQGELFASEHCKNLIKRIIEVNPNIKFNITSNGTLFSEENCKQLKLENRLNNVDISLHAASESTYNKITRSDENSKNYKKVQKNLQYLILLLKQKKISTLALIFVVHKYNYKEMIKILKKPMFKGNKNIIFHFWEYRPWETSVMYKEYEDVAVWLPENKNYKDFCRIISNKIFDSDNVVLPNLFLKLRKRKRFLEKILDFRL